VNKTLAKLLGKRALAHLEDTDPAALEWARGIGPRTFHNLRLRSFLEQYCWVVYASGFQYSIVEKAFPGLRTAFKNFDPESLRVMRSIQPVLKVFNNRRKAGNFLKGAKAIINEGFAPFKLRLASTGPGMLAELPGIGPITKDHLAKNIGLTDSAKPDRWLERSARLCGADTVADLTSYISSQLNESQHTVDVAIWTFAKDGRLPDLAENASRRAK
jgi:hypothetical protein